MIWMRKGIRCGENFELTEMDWEKLKKKTTVKALKSFEFSIQDILKHFTKDKKRSFEENLLIKSFKSFGKLLSKIRISQSFSKKPKSSHLMICETYKSFHKLFKKNKLKK